MHWSWRLLSYYEWRMKTVLVFSLGIRIFILTIIGWMDHLQVPLVHEKERRPLIGWRDFTSSHWPLKTSSRRGLMGGSLNLWWLVCVERERDLWFREDFWQEGGTKLKKKIKFYDKTNFLFLESSIYTFCFKFKLS